MKNTIKFTFEIESDVPVVDIIVSVDASEIKAGVSGAPLRISVRLHSGFFYIDHRVSLIPLLEFNRIGGCAGLFPPTCDW